MLVVERTDRSEAVSCLYSLQPTGAEMVDLRSHVDRSDVILAVCDDDAVHALVGAIRVTALSDTGYLWMVGLRPLGLGFARASRGLRAEFFKDFDVLVGCSHSPSAVRWLSWLGVDYGPQNADGAYPFVIRRADG